MNKSSKNQCLPATNTTFYQGRLRKAWGPQAGHIENGSSWINHLKPGSGPDSADSVPPGLLDPFCFYRDPYNEKTQKDNNNVFSEFLSAGLDLARWGHSGAWGM